MMLWKNCLATALSTAAIALVSANAQTEVQGVIQPAAPPAKHAARPAVTSSQPAARPAVTPSQPVIHAVPMLSPEAAPQPSQKTAEKPPEKPAKKAKAPEKPVHKLARRRVQEPAYGTAPESTVLSEPTYRAAPQPAIQGEPPILTAPTTQPQAQPAPTPRPYAQPGPAPIPQPQTQPAPQQYAQPAPQPQPYAQPAPRPYAPPAPVPQPYAQPTPHPSAQAAVEPVVNWTLQVIRDGQQIDSFNGTTTVGQTRTNNHHKVVTHGVGCKDEPAASIDLQRTIAVSPLRADPAGSVLAIDAHETLESDTTSRTPGGCMLPPQPSQVHANHPGLIVPAGQWVNWQIVGQDPSLTYRVRASVAPPSAQNSSTGYP